MEPLVRFTYGDENTPSINDTSKVAERVDPELVRQAFGAREVGTTEGLDILSLREAMRRMLASSGGRPSIEGVEAQVKIPRIEKDWEKIDKIAARLSASGLLRHKPSSTQTAAFIIHVALENLSAQALERALEVAVDKEMTGS